MKLNGEDLYFLWGGYGLDFENGVAFGSGCQDCELGKAMISSGGLGVLAD
jgi:hypothetical protein